MDSQRLSAPQPDQAEQAGELAQQIVAELTQRGETLAFCESLTAGLASATLATVPGASAVLRGGLVTYATELKGQLAGVDKHLLERYGPVSAPVAMNMARGARERCGATWGVALTGVAGPDPQDGHPVGEVHIAVAGPARTASTLAAELLDDSVSRYSLSENIHGHQPPLHVLAGERQTIRELAVKAAFTALIREMDSA